jgi:hypothetical protein
LASVLALAGLAVGDWPAQARVAALELSGVASDDGPINVALLTTFGSPFIIEANLSRCRRTRSSRISRR